MRRHIEANTIARLEAETPIPDGAHVGADSVARRLLNCSDFC